MQTFLNAAVATILLCSSAVADSPPATSRPSAASIPKPASSQPAGHPVAITGARVFDGLTVLPQATVLVRNGRIEAVGAKVAIPADAEVVDATGCTLLPGLIDSHTHVLSPEMLEQALVFGVTTELDMFMYAPLARELKDHPAAGKRADLRSAMTAVTAPGGHCTQYLKIPTLSGPADAHKFVAERVAEGSDYIKIIYDDGKWTGHPMPTLSRETMAATVKAAHAHGKLAVVHISNVQPAREVVEAGADGLAHVCGDAPLDPEFLRTMAGRTFVIPTLTVIQALGSTPEAAALAEDPDLAPYLTAAAKAQLATTWTLPGRKYETAQEAVRQLHSAHVRLLAGTDAPNSGTAHGVSLHRELELLVAAGCTPAEALAAATSVPAKCFGLTDRGTIAPSKRADLLLVKGDPTADILATRHIVKVWQAGVPMDREGFRSRIAADAAAAERRRNAPPPVGFESGLVSSFDSGKLEAAFGYGWTSSTDAMMGGKSRVNLAVVSDGAEGTAYSLKISGEIAAGGPVAWAGAMFFPGRFPMMPANLSSKPAISFWTRGDGRRGTIMVFGKSRGRIPASRDFESGREWKRQVIPLSAIAQELDGSDITGVLFSGSSEPGKFEFQVDDVRFVQPAEATPISR